LTQDIQERDSRSSVFPITSICGVFERAPVEPDLPISHPSANRSAPANLPFFD
jgi:hypothetical protein